ncbi:MAG: CoA transferase [Candidatus Tectomicrobia bacterium]|nr:CoA transferase [Candidatus Tectomicrobia bacterium]
MTERQEDNRALAGYRVLDLTDEKGLFCAKLLADLGADTIKIERPGGDPTRNIGPFVGNHPHPEKSLYFLYMNTNKRGITLNLNMPSGQVLFKRLVQTADIIVESFPPQFLQDLRLDYPTLKEVNPRLIMTSITGFGQTGPYRSYEMAEIVGFAMGGMMTLAGKPDKAPLVAPGRQSYDFASCHAAVGTLIALFNRGMTGEGQHVDLSIQESLLSAAQVALSNYAYNETFEPRRGSDFGSASDIFPCKDGYIFFFLASPRHWKPLVEWMGNAELKDPKWESFLFRRDHAEELKSLIRAFTVQYTKEELYQEAQRRHISIAPLNTPWEFLENPHIQAREFFVEVNHPEAGLLKYPGAPYKLSETPWKVARPAPRIGEHNEEIYRSELGLTAEELVALHGVGVI